MSDWTITAVSDETEDWSNDHGAFRTYQIEAEGSMGSGFYRLNQKASSDPPKVGDVIDADSTEKQGKKYLKRIWKENAPSNAGGGFRPRDPAERASIIRQHSQHMAVLWMVLMQKEGVKADEASLKTWTDYFDADAKGTA